MAIADSHFKKPPVGSGTGEGPLPFLWSEVTLEPQMFALVGAALSGAILLLVIQRLLRRKPRVED